MTKIVSITNNKGGVGKTTCNILLACRIKELGKKILLVDFEYPGYMTRFFNKTTSLSEDDAIMSLFREGHIKDPLKVSDSVSIYQCYFELPNVDAMGMDGVLNFAANIQEAAAGFDYVIIDTPPLLQPRLDCALASCTHVISVLNPTEFAIDGMGTFLNRYQKVRKSVNRVLPKLPYCFFNMYQGVNKSHLPIMEDFKQHYDKNFVSDYYLKVRKVIPDAISSGVPVWEYNTKKPIKDEALNVFNDLIQYLEK